jgi:hypothetical protein
MNVLLKGWRPEGTTIVPERIERRYCPTDEGHWRVDGDRCPVCRAKIETAIYALAEQGEDR